MPEISNWFPEILQPFVDRDTVVFSGLSAPENAQMAAFRELLKPFILDVTVRG